MAESLFNPIVLTKIELPTGQSYKFSYDIYGRIERIYYPTGGEERFVYNAVAPLTKSAPNNVTDQANFGVTIRKLYPTSGQNANYEWNYNVSYVAPLGYKVSTINPDNTLNERELHGGNSCIGCTYGTFGFDNVLAGMPYEELNFSGSNPRKLVTRQLTYWTKNTYQASFAERNPRVTHHENYIYDSDGNSVYSTTKFEYEFENNLTHDKPLLRNKVLEYGFATTNISSSPTPGSTPSANPTPVPTPVPPTLLRTTETNYLIADSDYPSWVQQIYKDINMVGLVSTSVVKGAAGTIVSRSKMNYDDGASSPALGRGNPTSLSIWDSSKGMWDDPAAYITTYAKFDTYGNQYEATDGNGNITQTTDARGISVTGYYDKLNRLKFRDYSDSTSDIGFFYDGTGSASVPAYSKGKTTKISSSVSETRYTSFNNLGRLLVSQQITDGQSYQSSYNYDAFGRLLSQTYPSGRTV